jgi:hypothetical protein
MPENPRQNAMRATQPSATANRAYATMAEAGARCYQRARDLPKLIALWPIELEDQSLAGELRILGKLRRALRAERARGLAGHWSYDLNRHLGLLSAYKGELAAHRKTRPRLNHTVRGGTRP